MIHVTFGSDVYGAVRTVDRTPIVTRFWMLQFLPVYPRQSYYFERLGKKSASSVPLLLTQREIVGIPCDRINLLSVLVAYARGIGAAMVVVSTMALFCLAVGRLSDPTFRFDEGKRIFATVAGSVLVAGLLLALPTYLFTVIVPARERRIRRACARMLGIAADPAHVKSEIAGQMIVQADLVLAEHGTPHLDAVLLRPREYPLPVLEMLLVRTRAQIQTGDRSTNHEMNTDRILEAIDRVTASRK